MSERINWTPEQFWEYVEGLAGDFNAGQMRDMLAERGLSLAAPGPLGCGDPSCKDPDCTYAFEPTAEQINAAAEVMWNDRDARHGGPWSSRDADEICVVQIKATARAALIAANRLDGALFPTTANSAEPVPVAYRWVLPGEHRWNVTVHHPRHHTAQTPAKIEPLYATLPSDAARDALLDLVAVHLNMLRGGIAKPSWANIQHLYPEEFAALSAAPVSAWQDEVKEIVSLFFSPWGAAKGARWEALSGDQSFNADVAMSLIEAAIVPRNDETSGGARS